MIITLTGENTFAIAAAKRQLTDGFVAKHGAYGVERVEAEELTPARLPDLLQGATLFAPARLVVITNVGANKAVAEPLAEALATAAPETTVVIADSTLDKRTKLYKFLKTKTTFKEFAAPTEAQLKTWLQAEATKLEAVLEPPEAAYLVERAGRDQWRLMSELQKLAPGHITKAAIAAQVEPHPEATAFELLDAALASKADQVGQLLAALKTQEDPYKLFGLIAGQIHTLAVVQAAGQRNPEVIAKEAGLHPFVVRKVKSAAGRLGAGRVQHLAEAVAQADTQLKSTGADPWDIIKLCLVTVASV